jgi:hypothetical protein
MTVKARDERLPIWRGIWALMLVAEHGGPTLMARIGMMPAPHRHEQPAPTPLRKRNNTKRAGDIK